MSEGHIESDPKGFARYSSIGSKGDGFAPEPPHQIIFQNLAQCAFMGLHKKRDSGLGLGPDGVGL